eukprot:1138883-Pelagomonas_calceolata.AAC.5
MGIWRVVRHAPGRPDSPSPALHCHAPSNPIPRSPLKMKPENVKGCSPQSTLISSTARLTEPDTVEYMTQSSLLPKALPQLMVLSSRSILNSSKHQSKKTKESYMRILPDHIHLAIQPGYEKRKKER